MHNCPDMIIALVETSGIVYIPKFREYGLRFYDGGTSFKIMRYCPWCGVRLPDSLRDIWFDRIHELGLEPDCTDIPAEFNTEAWWNAKK